MFEREKDRNKYFTQLAERGMGEVSGRRIGQQHEGAGQLGTQLEGDWVSIKTYLDSDSEESYKGQRNECEGSK